MTRAPRATHATAKQVAASRANLVKARAAQKARHQRTAKQVAASRRNLAKARAVQKARRAGKKIVTAKKPAAPLPGYLLAGMALAGESQAMLGLLALPVCGPLALAEHLGMMTGALASPDDILAFWLKSSARATLADLLELAKADGIAGNRLAYFERCDLDYHVPGLPGLLVGVQLGSGYHAAISVPGGMISWCQLVPRDGTPEEAWWLEWEGE